jgi:hypothetical protein
MRCRVEANIALQVNEHALRARRSLWSISMMWSTSSCGRPIQPWWTTAEIRLRSTGCPAAFATPTKDLTLWPSDRTIYIIAMVDCVSDSEGSTVCIWVTHKGWPFGLVRRGSARRRRPATVPSISKHSDHFGSAGSANERRKVPGSHFQEPSGHFTHGSPKPQRVQIWRGESSRMLQFGSLM